MLLCFSPKTDCVGAVAWAATLGLGARLGLETHEGLRRQCVTALTLSVGTRRRAPLQVALSRGGAAVRGMVGLGVGLAAGGMRGEQGASLDLAAGCAARLPLRMALAGNPLRMAESLIGRAIHTRGGLRGQLQCPCTSLPPAVEAVAQRRIVLQDVDITPLLEACTIARIEDDPHLRLTLTGVAPSLAEALELARRRAIPALVVTVAARTWRFVVTAVTVQDHLLEVQAAGASILQDTPYAAVLAVELADGPASARETVARILAPASLVWEMEDFPLPAGASLQDAPVGVASRIAAAGGGVLLGEADGGFRVRARFPYNPVTLPTAAPSLCLRAEEHLLGLRVTDSPGLPWGAVLVQGVSPQATLPSLALEEIRLAEDGGVAVVRAYWKDAPPETLTLTPWVSSGTVHCLGQMEEAVAERLEFVQGQARASFPVLKLLQPARWLGADGGEALAQSRSEILQSTTGGHGLADLRYATSFGRYQLRGVEAAEALFVLGVAPVGGVAVTVRSSVLPDAPVHPEVLEEPLAGSLRAAVRVGEAFLLDQCLPSRRVEATIPFDPAVEDMPAFRVFDPETRQGAHFLLTGWTLHCQGPATLHTLEGWAWRR